MTMTGCAVDGCSHTNQNCKIHRFPNKKTVEDIVRRQKWIDFCKRRADKLGNDWEPGPSSRICSCHFADDEWASSKGGAKRLREEAVPTVYVFNSIRGRKSDKESRRLKRRGGSNLSGDESFDELSIVDYPEGDTQADIKMTDDEIPYDTTPRSGVRIVTSTNGGMRVEVKTVEVCEADLRAAAERETAEYNATLSALVNGEYDYTTSRTVYCATSQHAESLAAAFLEKSVIKFRDIWSPKPFGELPNPDELFFAKRVCFNTRSKTGLTRVAFDGTPYFLLAEKHAVCECVTNRYAANSVPNVLAERRALIRKKLRRLIGIRKGENPTPEQQAEFNKRFEFEWGNLLNTKYADHMRRLEEMRNAKRERMNESRMAKAQKKQVVTRERENYLGTECCVFITEVLRLPQYRLLGDTKKGRVFACSLAKRAWFGFPRENVLSQVLYVVKLPSTSDHVCLKYEPLDVSAKSMAEADPIDDQLASTDKKRGGKQGHHLHLSVHESVLELLRSVAQLDAAPSARRIQKQIRTFWMRETGQPPNYVDRYTYPSVPLIEHYVAKFREEAGLPPALRRAYQAPLDRSGKRARFGNADEEVDADAEREQVSENDADAGAFAFDKKMRMRSKRRRRAHPDETDADAAMDETNAGEREDYYAYEYPADDEDGDAEPEPDADAEAEYEYEYVELDDGGAALQAAAVAAGSSRDLEVAVRTIENQGQYYVETVAETDTDVHTAGDDYNVAAQVLIQNN